MRNRPKIHSLLAALVFAAFGFCHLIIADNSAAQWAFVASLTMLRYYQLEAWHFEIEDEDDGEDRNNEADPVPTCPADDADWWKKDRENQ